MYRNRITIREMMKAASRLKEQGERFTLLGVGPMSKTLLTASLSLAKERDFPLLLIASRNQVDSDAFGHGYVCGWDQDRFGKDVEKAAADVGFDGLVYLCRDHGGPWQRDEERAAKLPEQQAMELCLRSYKHDLDSGFDLLHIDPTKDPHIEGTVPLDLVLDRTAELIGELERYRKEKGLPEVGYEAGTEETNGGRDIENGVRRTVMELPRAFRFSFSVRKEKIRIGSVPCFIQIRVSRLDFIRHHSFTNAIAAFAECLVCMNSQLMVAGDFIRRLPCPLQIT